MKRLVVVLAALFGFASIANAQQTAPPNLTIATVPNVVFLGDSIAALWMGAASLSENESLVGFPTWVKILTNYRIHAPVETNNFAQGAFTTANVLSTVPAALAQKPDICVVMAGRNDAAAGMPVGNESNVGSTIFNLNQIYNQLQAGGCVVFAIKILSQTFANWASSGATATVNASKALQINNWLNDQKLHRKGFYLVDNGNTYDDQTNTTNWAPKAHYVDPSNLIHPTQWGAYAIGKAIATQINLLYPDWRLRIQNVSDVYDAVNNPYGNLLNAQMFTGASDGSLITGAAVPGATGNVAHGWALSTINSGAGTFSAVASRTNTPDGRPAQTIVISGTPTIAGGFTDLRNTIAVGNVNQGDILQCSFDASWGATTGLNAVAPNLIITEAGTTFGPGISTGNPVASAFEPGNWLPTESSSGGGPAGSSISIPLYMPRHTVTAPPTVVAFNIRISNGAIANQAVAGTFQFSSPSCRKASIVPAR